MDSPTNSQVSQDRLSARDLARIKTNDPRLANRFATIGKSRYPILHLSIAETDIFKALTDKLSDIFAALSDDKLFQLLEDDSVEMIRFLQDDIPIAASMAIKVDISQLKKISNPIELLIVVLRQWVHNFEIDHVQRMYPMPEDDDPQEDIDGQPDDNPMTLDDRLCSNYGWTLEQSQYGLTYLQAYLMSNESAWSYAKSKANAGDGVKSKKITVPKKAGAKRFIERFGSNPAEQAVNYRAYMEELFGETRVREIKRGDNESN